MDGALGRDAQVLIQAPHQELANLARTPMGPLSLEADDQRFDLRRQLVGIAHRPTGAIAQRLEAALLVAIEDLVTGLAGDSELPARVRHRVAVEQLGNKAQALIHHRTLLPRHTYLPPRRAGKCYLCVRYVV